MYKLIVIALFVHFIWCINECGTGVNFCDLGMHLLWTKCKLPCNGVRKRETLMCCKQTKQVALHRNECLKMCNKTPKDITEERPCAQRCDHGSYDSKKMCHCQQGYDGQCCETGISCKATVLQEFLVVKDQKISLVYLTRTELMLLLSF